MNAQLIINADDYAISPGVSRAIRSLIAAGRVTATSCMTGSEFWPADGAVLRDLNDAGFSAGLHITLTDQQACVATPTLAPAGKLPSLRRLWRGLRTGKISRADIEVEVCAQIERFQDIFRASPGHIDGHHHVQQLPVVRDVILDLWRDGTIPADTWLRVSADSAARILRRRTDPLKAIFIAAAGAGLRAAAEQRGIPVNDGFAGVYDLQPDADFASVCRRALAVPAPRMVFMCHPGHADRELAGKDSVTYQRDVEFRFLIDDEFQSLLNGFGGRVVSRFG